MIHAANLAEIDWLVHGFGTRASEYPAGVIVAKQIHSNVVLDASRVGVTTEGDALVSAEPDLIAGVKTADCVPIFLADTSLRVVAAIHAGWRGTAAHIVAVTVRGLALKWGSRPEHLRAAIGPAIGPCCYEVGPDVARNFGICVSGPVHLDLPSLNERQLRDCGITNIWMSGECTFCAAGLFFSFRREKERAGRMLSFVGVKKASG